MLVAYLKVLNLNPRTWWTEREQGRQPHREVYLPEALVGMRIPTHNPRKHPSRILVAHRI